MAVQSEKQFDVASDCVQCSTCASIVPHKNKFHVLDKPHMVDLDSKTWNVTCPKNILPPKLTSSHKLAL